MSFEQKAIIEEYKRKKAEINMIYSKAIELEGERDEHRLVVSALSKLEPERKCFRMVEGVLIQRTVAEVLPAVSSNLEKLEAVTENLRTQFKEKTEEASAYKAKHNIRIVDQEGNEVDGGPEAASESDDGASGSSAGVLV